MEFYNFFLFSTQKQCTSWAFLCWFDPYLKYVPTIAVLIASLGVAIAYFNFKRKSDIEIVSTVETNQSTHFKKYCLSSYTLINKKDKPTVIYAVYFRIGYDLYIQLEDFSQSSGHKFHILKPYEVHTKRFEKIYWYQNNHEKISIDSLLRNPQLKVSIVISTSEGKYVSKIKKTRWNPDFGSRLYLKTETEKHGGYEDWEKLNFIEFSKDEISNNRVTFIWKKLINFFKKM